MKTSASDIGATLAGRARAACLAMACLAVAVSGPARAGEVDTVVQYSTIDALLTGLYDGVAEVGALKAHGDLGIGTFDRLDGEMVVLDGLVYRVGSDGRVVEVPDQETTPFATVALFKPDRELVVPEGTDYDAFLAQVSAALPSPNLFYALRAEGRFRTMRTRSVPKQGKPYRPLVEVVKEQSIFDFEAVDGVLVGFYSPPFAKGVNAPGYHLHFLTADRKGGGHVLAFAAERLVLRIDTLSRLQVNLPTTAGFAAADLQPDRQEALDKVEGRHR
jgi:acetolactate decarboxylase